jgi:hypothetical protein
VARQCLIAQGHKLCVTGHRNAFGLKGECQDRFEYVTNVCIVVQNQHPHGSRDPGARLCRSIRDPTRERRR